MCYLNTSALGCILRNEHISEHLLSLIRNHCNGTLCHCFASFHIKHCQRFLLGEETGRGLTKRSICLIRAHGKVVDINMICVYIDVKERGRCVYTYLCMYSDAYIYLYINICNYIYICVCVCVCKCQCAYAHTHICVYIMCMYYAYHACVCICDSACTHSVYISIERERERRIETHTYISPYTAKMLQSVSK